MQIDTKIDNRALEELEKKYDTALNTRDNGHAKGKVITVETALDGVAGIGVPLHAGAERFYREMGLLD